MTSASRVPSIVVFDLGGVLLDWDPRHLYRQLFDDPDDMEAFLEEVAFAEWNARQDAGRPWREAVEELATAFPDRRPLIEAFHARWPETVAGDIPGTVAVLGELRQAGVRLLALSNWSEETFAATADRFEFLAWFEGIVISGEVGAIKPDRRMFDALVDRFGVDPADAVFIDDSPANVEAARGLGFEAVRFTTPGELRDELVRLGLPLAGSADSAGSVGSHPPMSDDDEPPGSPATPSDRLPARARGFATRAIRAATTPPTVDQQPNAVPIYQTATFSSATARELGEVAMGAVPGHAYSRISNPTTDALADAIAVLEGAEAGVVLASGMGAIHAALLSLVGAGDRIVATRAIYGSTRSLLDRVFGRLGVATTYVDITDPAGVDAALQTARPRLLYIEAISNPTIVVADIPALADAAHRHGALLVIDATFASPYLVRPLEHGADLVVHSATKYIAGHSDVLAGAVVGSAELIRPVRTASVDTGGTLAPLAAFLVLRGIPTLALRMERHSATATALARHLEGRRGIRRVLHPSLASHPQAVVAARLLRVGGGMLAVELEGGRAAGEAFIDALTIPERTASLGSIHTIVAHPPSTTHRQYDDAALLEAGIAPGLLRVSVGLEDPDDLIADMDAALEVAVEAAS